MMSQNHHYRCAIIGFGARGSEQASVVGAIPGMELVAVCDPDLAKRQRARDEFGVSATYERVDDMLAEHSPDIVHIMTHPDVRVEPAVKAAEAGVRAVTMEKPMALLPSHAAAIAQASAETGCLMAVNHQRRYMAHNLQLRDALAGGRIGRIQFVRASTHGETLLTMPPHLVDLLLMMLGEPDPVEVWATSAGAEGFQSRIRHFGPVQSLARVLFADGSETLMVHAPNGVGVMGAEGLYQHLELNIWGTQGRAWTTDNGSWGWQAFGMDEPVSGPTGFIAHDDGVNSQTEFTRAIARWIEEPAAGHECSLDRALRGFGILMATAKSSLTGLPWRAGDEVTDGDVADLRALMEARESNQA